MPAASAATLQHLPLNRNTDQPRETSYHLSTPILAVLRGHSEGVPEPAPAETLACGAGAGAGAAVAGIAAVVAVAVDV